MQSEAGVRFELKRQSVDGDAVQYGLAVELSGEHFAGQARLGLGSGAVDFAWDEQREPPEWCVGAVRAQLRTLFREGSSGKPFPRRVTRWRPGPSKAAP